MSNLGRQIEAFRAVMLTGGMTKAAETIHITQSGVSRLISELELSLQLPLFHRRGNQLTPTPEATSFLAEVERSYLGLEQLKAYAADLRHSLSGSLRVAALPAMAFGFLPYCLAEFTRTRPKLSVVLDGTPSHVVLEQITQGQSELGFTERLIDHPSLNVTPITCNAIVVLPRDHPLAAHETLTLEQLIPEKLIMLSHKSYMRHTVENAIGPYVRSSGTIETTLSASAFAMAAHGMGIAILEPFVAATIKNDKVAIRRLTPAIEVKHSMITAKGRPTSRLVHEFASDIQRLADDFLADIFNPSDQG